MSAKIQEANPSNIPAHSDPVITHTVVQRDYPTPFRTKCGYAIIDTLPNRGLPPAHAVAHEAPPTCDQCARD